MVGVDFGEVFDSKFINAQGGCFFRVWCRHRPVDCGIGLYACGANDLTSWLKAITPASLRPYIHLQISRYTSTSAEMTYLYSFLISCGIFDGWIRMYC